MNEDDLRRLSAEKAMEFIKNIRVIGLGAGRTIACLIELLGNEVKNNNLNVKVVTPSLITKSLCVKHGIEVIPTCFIEEIDVAFDGCGQVDKKFYASKGGGGVFTKEKIIGSMANEYILLIDEQKLVSDLECKQPISLEVFKDSLGYVCKMVESLGGNPDIRTSNNKDGYTITDDGNFIVDVIFQNVIDFKKLNERLKKIVGVVETSLFTQEVTKLIVAGNNGVEVISK